MRQRLLDSLSGEKYRELFPAYAKSMTAPGYASEPTCHHAKHFIPGVMAVCVIEQFKVINIYHRYGVRTFQAGGSTV
jgi:hypothetical protein